MERRFGLCEILVAALLTGLFVLSSLAVINWATSCVPSAIQISGLGACTFLTAVISLMVSPTNNLHRPRLLLTASACLFGCFSAFLLWLLLSYPQQERKRHTRFERESRARVDLNLILSAQSIYMHLEGVFAQDFSSLDGYLSKTINFNGVYRFSLEIFKINKTENESYIVCAIPSDPEFAAYIAGPDHDFWAKTLPIDVRAVLESCSSSSKLRENLLRLGWKRVDICSPNQL